MSTGLPAGLRLGYCTNVHPGERLCDVCDNLEQSTSSIRSALGQEGPLDMGLWLSAAAIQAEQRDFDRLQEVLKTHKLSVFSFNGFPFGDFHAERVKHAVYSPDWSDPKRLEYTTQLATRLASLTHGQEASISTLPVGWKAAFASPERLERAGMALRMLAMRLHVLEGDGYFVHVDLEPEPGCVLETSSEVVEFFKRHLLCGRYEEFVRRHIRVCHDVSHAAVVFEPQAECFERYEREGIAVGKVQLSSALRVPKLASDATGRGRQLSMLRAFDEPRFLHQTSWRLGPAGSDGGRAISGDAAATRPRFFEDLGDALRAIDEHESPCGECRAHFHVPIHMESIGGLDTTRAEVLEALQAAKKHSACRHFEVETYAWGSLPEDLRVADLGAGIAEEIRWARKALGSCYGD